MYGNNTFDASAAFSGGGFMNPSQATPTADTSFTSTKNREAQVLLPLTVKQISESFQSSNCIIDGVDVTSVKLVGLLFQKNDRMDDRITFVLDDGTGRIDCLRWTTNYQVESKELELLSDGMYVKVHGHLKMGFQDKKDFVVYSVRRVTDYNEIANHFAECMYVHIYNTRKQKVKDASQVTGQLSNAAVGTPSKGYQPQKSDNDVEKHVLNYLQQPKFINHPHGAHRDDIAKQLNLPEQKIVDTLESLVGEGLVYTSTDEFHYKCIANG